LKYPRFIHAEFMTHRMLSKNAGSSRAVPAAKMIAQVREEPAFFVWVGKNQAGMQAQEEVDTDIKEQFYKEWKELAGKVTKYVERWSTDYGIHKQNVNRVLEPFLYMNVVVTGTEWDNFFLLRDHEDAQPEIRDLAQTMKQAYQHSKARYVTERHMKDPRDWHLPYVTMEERKTGEMHNLLAMSAARCARVSYLTHNKENPKAEEDWSLYKRLVESEPRHSSPLEHQACVAQNDFPCYNLRGGWISHRFVLDHCGTIAEMENYLSMADRVDISEIQP